MAKEAAKEAGKEGLPERDARVEAAASHWGPRFVANGTDAADFTETLGRIARWGTWCKEWGRTADRYAALAEREEAAGHALTAAGAWRRAGMAWHWAKFVFVTDPVQLSEASRQAVACYEKGAWALEPPAQRVAVPYGSGTLSAYLRVPETADRRPPPVVVMVPGLDSVKEELQATARVFCAREMATLAIDGPGQGEAEEALAIEPEYEKVASAALDFCEQRSDVDAARAGVYGVSLGGYYASRCMAFEPRLRAGVELCGPYQFDLGWDAMPELTKATFAFRSRSADASAARAFAARLTLQGALERVDRPFLVVHGRLDRIVGSEHAERIAREAPGAELMMVEDGNHGITNHPFESRARFCDWMADRLGAAAPT